MIRFIHLADVHLGAVPDRGCPWSREREEEIWETFRRVIATIRKSPVDLLFIAGDLFHRQPLLSELREINDLFATIPGTRVFLMAGDNDYMKEESFYRTFKWNDNVSFFDGESRTCIEIPEKNIYVYGLSYEHREIHEALYDDWKKSDKRGFHVLMAHGGDEQHIPLDFRKLAEGGFDYIALGHRHQHQAPLRDWTLYSGALEPIDRNDLGEHGYIEGTYDEGTVRTHLVPFASRSYQNLLLTVREGSTQHTLEEMLRNEIMKRGGKNIYRVIIQGTRSPGSLLLAERLKTMGNIVEVLDESRPAYDLKKLHEQYKGTLIGDYIEQFTDNAHRSVVEDKALYHGLQSLLNASVLVNGRVMQDAEQKDLGRILQMLKMSRKGYQVQVERRKKDDLAEKQKIRNAIDRLNIEIHELEEQRAEVRSQEESLQRLNGGRSEEQPEERIRELERKNQFQAVGLGATAVLFLAGALIMGIYFKETMLGLVVAATGICLLLLEGFFNMKTIRELEKRRRWRKRFLARKDSLQSGQKDLDQEIKEKNTELSNLLEEYQEAEDYIYLPLAEEIEIDSLNLAMTTIEKLARKSETED
nr:metallophosphoesterase [uncultured Blautia sp.]